MSKMMNNDQIQIVKDDLTYILDLVEKADSETHLKELMLDIQVICHRDIRILGNIKWLVLFARSLGCVLTSGNHHLSQLDIP